MRKPFLIDKLLPNIQLSISVFGDLENLKETSKVVNESFSKLC